MKLIFLYILQIDEQVQKAFQLWQDVSDLRLIFLQSFINHRQKKTAVYIVKRKHIMNHNKNYDNNNINNNENENNSNDNDDIHKTTI